MLAAVTRFRRDSASVEDLFRHLPGAERRHTLPELWCRIASDAARRADRRPAVPTLFLHRCAKPDTVTPTPSDTVSDVGLTLTLILPPKRRTCIAETFMPREFARIAGRQYRRTV